MTRFRSYFVTGGAGFIGSHFVAHVLETKSDARVTVFDNFSSGRMWHLSRFSNDPRLTVIREDARNLAALRKAIPGHDIVYHFAANSDIARAQWEPAIDFENGTLPTHYILEAMRLEGVRRIVFTSGSGVYGEVPPVPIPEEYPRMIPVSTYGACKLACEALISAYCFMFEMTGTVFRFANVVGPNQTHGVAYDFVRRLFRDPTRLKILGDGSQSKPYIHVDDVIAAFDLLEEKQNGGYEVYNVGTSDYLTVKEIADIVCARVGLKDVEYRFTGGNRGWKADVPVYRLDTSKIARLGWSPRRNSRQAVTDAVDALIQQVREGYIEPAAESDL